MTTRQNILGILVTISITVLALGCGGDSKSQSDAGVDGGANDCESFDNRNDELLNAPTDSTIVLKTPTHPPLGSGGLP
jgi:hypothetical protein